jgi:hypothetical protein
LSVEFSGKAGRLKVVIKGLIRESLEPNRDVIAIVRITQLKLECKSWQERTEKQRRQDCGVRGISGKSKRMQSSYKAIEIQS